MDGYNNQEYGFHGMSFRMHKLATMCIYMYAYLDCAGPLPHGFVSEPITPSDTMPREDTGVEPSWEFEMTFQ